MNKDEAHFWLSVMIILSVLSFVYQGTPDIHDGLIYIMGVNQ